MPTYPLSIPSGIGIVSSSWRLQRIVSETSSIFTGAQQTYIHPGAWWEGEVTFQPMRRSTSAALQAFLLELRGKSGTFLFSDPDALGLLGAGGTIIVNGAGQTGTSLLVDGMTLSTNNILRPGDYFQLGSGATRTLHMATQALNSNGSGEGTLTFEPPIKLSPADNSAVVITDPKGVFKLSENAAQWNGNFSSIQTISIAFKEAISI